MTHWARIIIPFVLTGFLASRPALSHEGHQPLPTKGVQVDSDQGNITLSSQARDAIGLESSEVAVGDVASTLFAYAETIAPWQSKAYGSAQLSGRITKLFVRPGDSVSKNQVIATLSSRELEVLRSEYLQAKQGTASNSQLVELARPSANAGAIPMQRLLEAENALQQTENNLAMVRIRAGTLGIDPKELDLLNEGSISHSIRSPIVGKVIHSDLSEGKFVEAFEHVYEIVHNDQVWVRLQLLEKDIHKVTIGQEVELSFADRGVDISGKIDRVEVSLEPKTQVSWAWMTISHSAIVPGLVGAARIRVSHSKDRLCVPLHSVYSDGLQNYVFVEVASTKTSAEYRKRNVQVGSQTLDSNNLSHKMVEILQGDVYSGDRVVVKGGHELSSLFFLGVLKLSESDRSRLGIRTSIATSNRIAEALRVAGIVTLPQENRSVISSQLAGTIKSHSLSPGRPIKKGELLFEVVAPEFHSLQLDLIKTSLDANLTRSRSERLEAIGGQTVSQRLRIETLATAEQLEKRADSLRRQLVSLGLSEAAIGSMVKEKSILESLPVRAPIDGNLVRWTGTLGKTITANEALAEIQNTRSVWIEAFIPVQEMHLISENNVGKARLLCDDQIEFPVNILRVGPIVDEVTRTQRVYLMPDELPRETLLRDGMQLSIDLRVREGETALTIPNEAILRDGLHTFVFVQKADGYIERRRVSTGRSDGELTEVTKGIRAGEQVIVAGGRELQTAYASLR